MTPLVALIDGLPLTTVGLVLGAAMAVAAALGGLSRRLSPTPDAPSAQTSTIIGGGLGLLGLLLGFTLSMAINFFEQRRLLVIEEANAIGTAYLRVQFLEQPHRDRMSDIFRKYVDNRIILADAQRGEVAPLLADNDALLEDLWAATLAAAPTLDPFVLAPPLVQAVNDVIDDDMKRKAARVARVPPELFLVLFVTLVAIAAMLGHFTVRRADQVEGGLLLAIMAIAYILVMDINTPTRGTIREDQRPMLLLQASLRAGTEGFDRYRSKRILAIPPGQDGRAAVSR